MVGDEDHGAFLDRHGDPLCDRVRPLLPRLHLLPTLSKPGDIVVVIGAEAELIAALAADVAPDGDVVVVDGSVDTLERLRNASPEPDVTYLVGDSEVLPLPDESVDAVRTMSPPNAPSSSEFFRVLRPGGQVSVGGSTESALNLGAGMLTEAGFVDVAVIADDRGPSLDARKP
ncbi:MAG: methyltransferase domain-containing protein [Gaiellaceae bacterium]